MNRITGATHHHRRARGRLLPRAVLVGGIVALTMTGCGASSRSAGDPPAISGEAQHSSGGTGDASGASGRPESNTADLPTIASEADVLAGHAFPLDAFALSPTQIRLINQAEHMLESTCMATKGFTMPAYLEPSDVPPRSTLVTAFGLGSLSEARLYGYDIPPMYQGPQKPTTPETGSAGTSSQPDASYDIALRGPREKRPSPPPLPLGGGQLLTNLSYTPDSCTGRAYEAIDVSPARAQELMMSDGSVEVSNARLEARRRTDADPRVAKATREWSACMSSSGFTAANPTEASLAYGPAARSLAIAAAIADVTCKYDTNYFGVMYGVTVEYQQQLIDKGLTGLEILAKSNTKILDNANAVIAGG